MTSAGAADVHLLQAAGHRARPSARRAEPARLQELDADARPILVERLAEGLRQIAAEMDAIDRAGAGRPCRDGRRSRGACSRRSANWPRRTPDLPILADSRRGPGRLAGSELQDERRRAGRDPATGTRRVARPGDGEKAPRPWPAAMAGRSSSRSPSRASSAAAADGSVEHVPALPVRGPIDIVGAGDAVTANLAAALSSGASLREAIELAAIASSVVIHQLGTTGTAQIADLAALLDRTD